MEMDILSMIPVEIYPLIVVLWIIGAFIKNTEKVKDCYIPFILLVFAIAAAILKLGVNVDAVIIGVMAVGVAVLGENLLKQGGKAIKGES